MLIQSDTVTPSPFHGIFSSLSDQGTDDGPWKGIFSSEKPVHREKEQTPTRQESLAPSQSPPTSPAGRLAVDVYEQDGYYIIRAPIAGIRISDVDIEVNDRTITIRGNRKQSDAVEGSHYYLQECFFGPFARSVTLPFEIDARKIRATFNKECILKILIPKEEKVKVVRISEA